MELHERAGFLETLSRGTRDAFHTASHPVVGQRGSALVRREDRSGDGYILLSGMVKEELRAGRKKIILGLRGRGDLVGAGTRAAMVSVVAVGKVEALRVPGPDFASIVARCPDAAEGLRRVLADRRREAEHDRISAASLTPGERLARLVLQLGQRHGVAGPDGLTIADLSQSELAGRLDLSPRTVSRKLGTWCRRGIVSTSRRSVTVHRLEQLRQLAARS